MRCEMRFDAGVVLAVDASNVREFKSLVRAARMNSEKVLRQPRSDERTGGVDVRHAGSQVIAHEDARDLVHGLSV